MCTCVLLTKCSLSLSLCPLDEIINIVQLQLNLYLDNVLHNMLILNVLHINACHIGPSPKEKKAEIAHFQHLNRGIITYAKQYV